MKFGNRTGDFGIEFNYNKFLKIGVSSGTNPYVFVLNNDIRAHKGCMKELTRCLDTYHSVSPMNPLMPQQQQTEYIYTIQARHHN